MNKFSILAAVAASLATLAAAPASAEEFQVSINYADLDVASEAGASTLAQRIDAEAKAACAAPGRDIKSLAVAAKCEDGLRSSAVEQLNARGAVLAAGSLAAK